MTLEIRPMTGAEYEVWAPLARTGYAQDMIEHGGYPRDAAEAKAERDFAQLLTAGLETEGHSLYTIADDGKAAGDVWIAERDSDLGRTLFVYDVHVDETQRGRGLGRAAMLFVEAEARRRGVGRVSLNVFGGNHVARALYRSLGYRETAVWMAKEL